VGRHRPEPGLTSTAAEGGTGARADGQGGAGWGEQGAAGQDGAVPFGRCRGWVGRSRPSVEEAAAAGDEEAAAVG
jgi:hypothetical protein